MKDKPKRLRPLANRQTRIRLIAASFQDAAVASVNNEAKGRGGRRWILPRRNEALWEFGSYEPFEKAMDHLREEHHDLYAAFHRIFVHDPFVRTTSVPLPGDRWGAKHYKPTYSKTLFSQALAGFKIIDKLMPREIFVPQDVSENAGYLRGEAKQYQKARKK